MNGSTGSKFFLRKKNLTSTYVEWGNGFGPNKFSTNGFLRPHLD